MFYFPIALKITINGNKTLFVDFENEKSLIDDGLIESLDIVSIVNEIMGEFDVEIYVDDLMPENFNSAEDMMNLIRKKQA